MKQCPLWEAGEPYSAGLHDSWATHVLPCSQVASGRGAGVFTDSKEFMRDKAVTENTAGYRISSAGGFGAKSPKPLSTLSLGSQDGTTCWDNKEPVFGEP